MGLEGGNDMTVGLAKKVSEIQDRPRVQLFRPSAMSGLRVKLKGPLPATPVGAPVACLHSLLVNR